MVFIADDLAAWLTGLLADAGRKRLTSMVLGTELDRALASAAGAAIRLTGDQLCPGDNQRAEQVAMVISEVFKRPVPDAQLARQETLLESLQAGVVKQLSVLDDPDVTGTGKSSAEVLDIPAAVLAKTLAGNLVREIIVRGVRWPLAPVAAQLNHDLTHLQGQRIEDILGQLGSEIRKTLPLLDTTQAVASKPVTAWNAFDLGVHAAIDTEADDPPGPPSYICRSHDQELRGLLSGEGDARMVVLVGGSCTGKTRACYEAVRERLGSWLMFRPADASELERLLLMQRTDEPAVVWLDEAHIYLDGQFQRGTEAARCLQHVLSGESRSLVVIGTISAERWAELTAKPQEGMKDPHLQARKLLEMHGVSKIHVPDDFSSAGPGELRELGRAAEHDPRLAAAQRTGGDRLQITQVLAGGVLLLQRYLRPPDIYSRAVVRAAMDARRLGHSDPISPALLQEAVPGYLTAGERSVPAGWFDTALAKAAEVVRGVRALTPARREAGMGDPDGYILHDYLDQHGRTAREAVAPPASLWHALLVHAASTADLIRAAGEASSRGLYRYAVLAAARAAEAADTEAILFVVRLLDETGRAAECIAWLLPFAEAGDANAMLLLAEELMNSRQPNRSAEGVSWLRRAAESGNTRAMWEWVKLTGALAAQAPEIAEETIRWLRQLAHRGDQKALRRLAELLDELGRTREAGLWRAQYAQATQAWHTGSRERYMRALQSGGVLSQLARGPRVEEEVTALRIRAASGELKSMNELGNLLDDAGQADEAIGWLRQAAEAGHYPAAMDLAQILSRLDRDEEALTTVQRMAASWSDSWMAFERVLPWLRKVGGVSSLRSFLTAAASAGNNWAAVYLAAELERNGQTVEAIRWLEPAAEVENLAAMEFLGVLRQEAGQDAISGALYQRVDQAASPDRFFLLASMLENGGWPERALIRYRNAIECKEIAAMEPLRDLLERMGRTEEAKRLETFGIEAGGHTAQPWLVPPSAPIAASVRIE